MQRLRPFARILVCGAVFSAAAPAAALEPGGPEVSAAADLLAVLHLRGKPCVEVASHRRLAESDYEVVCSGGPRYRIRVDAEQRVTVEALPPAAEVPDPSP